MILLYVVLLIVCLLGIQLRKSNDEECEYIVATRFHAMVIGWALRKKVFPIIYSKKTLNVIQDVNFHGKYWNLLSGQSYNVESLLMDIIGNENLQDVENEIEESKKQFLVFEKNMLDK